MIQRASVRVRVISGERTLLVRRAEGRPAVVGKYELPGGRILEGEQPEDTALRHLTESLGMSTSVRLMLDDVMTYVDRDARDVQYLVTVYRAYVGKKKRSITLAPRYDKYTWYSLGRVDRSAITELSKLILGTVRQADPPGPGGPTIVHKHSDQQVVVYTDGGSRGNPGPSAGGYVVLRDEEVIDRGGEYLGITTNNQAEYHGVRLGLEAALRLGIPSVEVRVDSMLVANQLNGIYKIKNRELWPVNERVRELVSQFERVKFTHVPREMNQLADSMVNQTLDQRKRSDMV